MAMVRRGPRRRRDRLAALSPERVEETDELYVLSANGGDTVKARAGLLDVKRLQNRARPC
jgi:hypothetical protein